MTIKYQKEKEMSAAKTRVDALNAGVKYFIGELCYRNHKLSIGESMSLRYASNGTCVVCDHTNSCSSKIRKLSSEVDGKSRRSIEDIMLAREFGISVDDL